MAELLRNAWMGWFRMTDAGKLMALFLVALLFLWLSLRQEKQKQLLYYSTVMAACCILPVTAVCLMLYQTRFYDYEWIWSAVPVTIVIGYAETKFMSEHWQGFRLEAWRKGLPVTIGLLLIMLLCGGLGGNNLGREAKNQQKAETAELLASIDAEGERLCLWAPQGVMEYARILDSSILLPYGRNMWEEALDAYSYDTYSKEIENLYLWMCMAEGKYFEEECADDEAAADKLSTKACLETARQAGVNLLILPEDTDRVLLNEITDFAGMQPERSLGYYLFRL